MGFKKRIKFLLDYSQSEKEYIQSVDGVGVFDNRFSQALPQTTVAQLVRAHFSRENGKQKKALLIGFDGCRADAMLNVVKSNSMELSGDNWDSKYSAICRLKRQGGLYLSFAGGLPGDAETKQTTSTAQGWAAILTGVWSKDNGIVKGNESIRENTPTVLRELARQGKPSAFLGLWPDHFTYTYKREMELAEETHLPLRFTKYGNDMELHQAFLDAIAGEEDCIFGIYEGPDSNGHGWLFGNNGYRYVQTVMDLDRCAYELMERVEARPTYETEDWLILITADHGGHATWHGTQAVQDRETFLAVNQQVSL